MKKAIIVSLVLVMFAVGVTAASAKGGNGNGGGNGGGAGNSSSGGSGSSGGGNGNKDGSGQGQGQGQAQAQGLGQGRGQGAVQGRGINGGGLGKGINKNWSNVPADISAKLDEVSALRAEMRSLLAQNPIDSAKVAEVHAQMIKLNQEISDWRFEQKMSGIQNVPEDIKAKFDQISKLREEMRDVMTKNPSDTAKAAEIREQMMKLNQEIREWRFSQRPGRFVK